MPKSHGTSQFDKDFSPSGRYGKADLKEDLFKVVTNGAIIVSLTFTLISGMTSLGKGMEQAMAKGTVQESPLPSPTLLPSPSPELKEDERVTKLRSYLIENDSSLADYAGYIVEQSDRNGLDWTLIVAIANKESSLCKQIKPGSHNCWGIGGASGFRYFSSYEESIKYEAELLNRSYRNVANRGIQQKYCPDHECASNWVVVVSDTSRKILSME